MDFNNEKTCASTEERKVSSLTIRELLIETENCLSAINELVDIIDKLLSGPRDSTENGTIAVSSMATSAMKNMDLARTIRGKLETVATTLGV